MTIRRYHAAHLKRRPSPWERVRRAYRTAAVHFLLEVAGGHLWNSLALAAMAGLAAVPADWLAEHSALRTVTPALLAIAGIVARITGRAKAMENGS
jgi:hypothetical protein